MSTGTERICLSCNRRAEAPILGHDLCSYHRSCFSPNQWVPDNCDKCKAFKQRFRQMSPEDKNANLHILRMMLKRMEVVAIINGNSIQFHYHMAVNNFLNTNLPSNDRDIMHD